MGATGDGKSTVCNGLMSYKLFWNDDGLIDCEDPNCYPIGHKGSLTGMPQI